MRRDARHAGRGQGREGDADAHADERERHGDLREVVHARRDLAEPGNAGDREPEAADEQAVLPKRGVSFGTTRPIANITAVMGRKARPACSALNPLTPCRNCVRKKNVENMPPTTRTRAAYAPERARSANRCSGVIGCSARDSVTMKPASSAAPAANEASVRRSPQPSDAGSHEAVDQRGHPRGRGDRSREVEAPRAALGLGQEAGRERHHDEADGHVDEEPPAPRQPVGERAAEHEADAAAAARDGAVIGDRARALGAFAERRRQQRERRGRRDRSARRPARRGRPGATRPRARARRRARRR